MKRYYNYIIVIIVICVTVFISCRKDKSKEDFQEVNLRLQWMPQCQFAGYIVAAEKGYYAKNGLKVNLLPAGPDLKPHVTVAAGTDQIGIGVPNQIIAARSNGVPLVIIAQIFQDSANRYVLKAKNRINELRDLVGRKVGLWLGGDEVEFIAMLKTAGMTLSDIEVIPQKFSVIPFLEDEYVLSQVTVYNELNLIRMQGYDGDELQVISPKDYDSAILGDMIFTSEKYLRQNKETVTNFLEASISGWKFCLQNPAEALEIVLKYNPELKREDQKLQLEAANKLVISGLANEKGIGYIHKSDYETAQRILFETGQIRKQVPIEDIYDISAWEMLSLEVVEINK